MRQLIDDLLWAARLVALRRIRRRALFSTRVRIDDAARKIFGESVMAYPDALYHVGRRELAAAKAAAQRS